MKERKNNDRGGEFVRHLFCAHKLKIAITKYYFR